MATDVERSVYFYSVEGPDAADWRRDEVLRALDELQDDSERRFMPVRGGDFVFCSVDRIPARPTQVGRLRLLRSRRQNLPAMEEAGRLSPLPLPKGAGLAEPSHVVMGRDGVVAAEFNFFAPRMSALAAYIHRSLGVDIHFGTYVQGEILDQLDRLEDVRLLELSVWPSPQFLDAIGREDPISEAVSVAASVPGERRVSLSFSASPDDEEFTEGARAFARRAGAMDVTGDSRHGGAAASAARQVGGASVLRVRGFDPMTDNIEWVDLLEQKVVRRVRVARQDDASRALDTDEAYSAVFAALKEARETDLPNAVVID